MGTIARYVDGPIVDSRPRAVSIDSCLARRRPWLVLTGVVSLTSVAALLAFVGSDSRWLAALGNVIAARHAIPNGVPFASAPSATWPNTLVLAELVFHALESSLGDRGLMVAQLIAVALALGIVARDALAAGASARGATAALTLACCGALPSLIVARAQLFSLVLFPLLIMLLRSEARAPSRRIWLVIPLIALWSNLHGVALVGVLIACIYLLFGRARTQPMTAACGAVGAIVALCLNPAGLRAFDYYRGVVTNVAAQRGLGLSAPLSLTRPLDIVLIAVSIALLWRVRRIRPAPWEIAAIIVLGAISIHSSRAGVWLLLFVAPLAACGMTPGRVWERVMPALATVSILMLCYAVARGPLRSGADPALVRQAVILAHGTPIVADDILDEQVALVGGRIWVGNPIDAFSQRDQRRYLDWIEGLRSGRGALGPRVRVVVTAAHSPAERLMNTLTVFVRVYGNASGVIYTRRT